MCGIAGFLNPPHSATFENMERTAREMSSALEHRGPDDAGVWLDWERGVALGHRRLSILDLSPEGHQPMRSPCGRYVLSFNGEIYTHAGLRQRLAGLGHPFRGHSDTEVMLAAIVEWGLVEALTLFNGMFACAVWDRTSCQLHLARDRSGEKPVYYGWLGNTFAFGSEIKALRAHPRFDCEIDREALVLYLRYSYIPAPHSIYRGIRKLMPGTVLTVQTDERSRCQVPVPYWSARAVVERRAATRFRGSDADAIGELDTLVGDAVRIRMEADVPLGAFLSGGIDSSTVVAFMQANS
ncbi:MAG: asparagine synthase (glutamine-hydrolyzing), partial [Bryobacteraceae bacterium]